MRAYHMATVRLVPKGKTQSILFLDGETAGPVKNSDMAFLSVTDGADINGEKTEEILLNCILPAGKRKALDLLGVADRTEKELRDRLAEAGYGEAVIVYIMDYVKQFPYLNDSRYAYNYLYSFGGKKSLREIRQKLMEKGITDELYKDALARYLEDRKLAAEARGEDYDPDEDPELFAVRKLAYRKVAEGTPLSREQREKLSASLLRKGFPYGTVRRVVAEYPKAERSDEGAEDCFD